MTEEQKTQTRISKTTALSQIAAFVFILSLPFVFLWVSSVYMKINIPKGSCIYMPLSFVEANVENKCSLNIFKKDSYSLEIRFPKNDDSKLLLETLGGFGYKIPKSNFLKLEISIQDQSEKKVIYKKVITSPKITSISDSYYYSILGGIILDAGNYDVSVKNINPSADMKEILSEFLVRYSVRAK